DYAIQFSPRDAFQRGHELCGSAGTASALSRRKISRFYFQSRGTLQHLCWPCAWRRACADHARCRHQSSPDVLASAQLNGCGIFDVWEIAALGGSPRTVIRNATDPAWTPDGQSLICENYAD